ncbi:hypothetical protein EXS56_01555 [Candidatus Kaiserbacteria bacterium]|nr:hypothetical protein [Candidatus Kaiserbacteria bacterium]
MNVTTTYLAFLAIGGAIVLLWLEGHRPGSESFLVAGRKVGPVRGTLTVFANWMHAPAIIASGVLAYRGFWFFMAFFIPNVLALVLKGYVAPKIQRIMWERNKRYRTMAEALGDIFESGAVRTMMFLCTFGALAFAVGYTFAGIVQWVLELGAVMKWLNQFSTGPQRDVAIALAVVAFLLVAKRGLPDVIRRGDMVKVALITTCAVGTLAFFVFHGGTVKGPQLPFENMTELDVFFLFGIPLAASLFGGPICNPDLPERTFAVAESFVRWAYFRAALLFGLGIIIFGLFGFLARDLGYGPSGNPMAAVLKDVLQPWAFYLVAIIIIAIFTTALMSLLASAGDVFSIEVVNRLGQWFGWAENEHTTVSWSRAGMLIAILIGAYLASFEKLDVRVLQASMAPIRGEAIFAVLFAVWAPYMSSRYVFVGMFLGAVTGIPYTLGSFFPEVWSVLPFAGSIGLAPKYGATIGAILAVFVPFVICSFGWMVAGDERRPQAARQHI